MSDMAGSRPLYIPLLPRRPEAPGGCGAAERAGGESAREPTAALDSQRAAIVMDLLRKLAVEQQAAIIAVTHDEKIFDRFDRVFELRDGRLKVDGAEV
jgi:hypothetical protein